MNYEKIILITLVLFLAGCNDSASDRKAYVFEDWEMAPRVYTCTEAQMIKAHGEAEWCNEHTSYFKNYCYGTALMSNCTKRESAIEIQVQRK